MQAQPKVMTRGQNRVRIWGKVGQQPGELGEGLRRIQLVEIINHQRDVVAGIGEFREHPSTIACSLKSGVAADGSASLAAPRQTDRVEQSQPELLGILLIPLHLHDSKPVRLTGTVGPRPQQRRLPAAGRSRDDRHFLRRRAIKSGEKIIPVDQPGVIRATVKGLPWYLRLTPGVGVAILVPLSRYQASARAVNGPRTSVLVHSHSRPCRTCRRPSRTSFAESTRPWSGRTQSPE